MNDLDLALDLADLADSLSLSRFIAQDFTIETKPDLTPVTECDRAVESALVDRLAVTRPEDSVLGEEFGSHGSSERRWIIDPIDGTKNYVRGVPVWATLISLYEGQRPLLGVVSAPALSRRWWAAAGQGAFARGPGGPDRRIEVSRVDDLGDASLSFASLGGWRDLGVRDEFIALTDAVWRTRGYGDFYSYMLVAEGAVDIACEPELALYDMGALAPIVLEAGGAFTNTAGVPGVFGGNAVATNGRLHERVLDALGRVAPEVAE
ncbi:histidinol-phosphatase [Brevibacterium casei]|uniref:Histidinol-phosphatase n=1 Tax=Brevibacterium casei S18 TaxID=1229781 RepID=K9ATU2_9MICO|nr:histidinol-phosphatase [Brevibacterium casei]EKU49461.1 histidinol-phosphate phosphatase [Brevibacterium casei S18]MCT2358270.1 histidinol-phosphatase [Brevibacterium casei]QQT68240.1 histidinol-phosphatase [Brevibacterium casei]